MLGKKKKSAQFPNIELVVNDFSEDYLRKISLFYEFNITVFNKAYIVLGFLVLCMLIGFFSKHFLWFGFAGLVVVLNQYLKMKIFKKSITLKREVLSSQAKCGEAILISYEVTNNSELKTPTLLIKDLSCYLEYPKNGNTFAVGPINKNSRIEHVSRPICEAPPGKLDLGNTQIEVQDELGLFKFKLNFYDPASVYVSNQDELNGKNQIRRATDSPLTGDLEISKVGNGLSLLRLREYRDGDPLRMVSWKKSTLDEQFLVKEFESDIARRVVFQISQDAQSQVGYGASSTWELAKSITLSLINKYLRAHSSVSFVSEQNQLKDLSGAHLIDLFEKTIGSMNLRGKIEDKPSQTNSFYFEPLKQDSKNFEMELVEHHINAPCLFYYVSPSLEDLDIKIKYLLHLKDKGFEPMFVYVSPHGSSKIVSNLFKASFLPELNTKNDGRTFKKFFISSNIPLLVAEAQSTKGIYKVDRYGG